MEMDALAWQATCRGIDRIVFFWKETAFGKIFNKDFITS